MELYAILYEVSGNGISWGNDAFNINNTSEPYQVQLEANFDTPGSFGAFSQSAFEADLFTWLTAMCQLQADQSGQTLAEAQAAAGFTINREWSWVNTEGATLTWNDSSLTYPT
jgi:hypothetical protein